MLVFIGLFWGFMLFDMVAEESIQNGFLVLFIVSFIYTAIIWYTTTTILLLLFHYYFITITINIRLLRILLQPSFSTVFHIFLRKIRVTKSSSSNVKLNSNSTNVPAVVKDVTTIRKGNSLETVNRSSRRISFSDAVPSPMQSPVTDNDL